MCSLETFWGNIFSVSHLEFLGSGWTFSLCYLLSWTRKYIVIIFLFTGTEMLKITVKIYVISNLKGYFPSYLLGYNVWARITRVKGKISPFKSYLQDFQQSHIALLCRTSVRRKHHVTQSRGRSAVPHRGWFSTPRTSRHPLQERVQRWMLSLWPSVESFKSRCCLSSREESRGEEEDTFHRSPGLLMTAV